MYRHFLNMVEFFSKFIAKFYVPFNHRKVVAFDYRIIARTIKPGDLILCRANGYLSNIFIGQYTHAALYVGHEKVIEATTEGVVKSDIIDLLLKRDKVLILRPKFLYPLEINQSIRRAHVSLGKKYDFKFQQDIKSFYCSEIVLYCYSKPGIFKLSKKFGTLIFSPDDFLKNKHENFEVIYEVS